MENFPQPFNYSLTQLFRMECSMTEVNRSFAFDISENLFQWNLGARRKSANTADVFN